MGRLKHTNNGSLYKMYGNQIRQMFTNSKGNNDTHTHLHDELEEQEAHYDVMI